MNLWSENLSLSAHHKPVLAPNAPSPAPKKNLPWLPSDKSGSHRKEVAADFYCSDLTRRGLHHQIQRKKARVRTETFYGGYPPYPDWGPLTWVMDEVDAANFLDDCARNKQFPKL